MASRRTEKQNMLRQYEKEMEEKRQQEALERLEEDVRFWEMLEEEERRYKESLEEEERRRQQLEDAEFLARFMNDDY